MAEEAVGRILLTGGTGLIGGRFAALHRERGGRLRCASRSARSGGESESQEWVVWDGVSLPPGALDDCGAVVHLAGEPVFGGRLSAKRKRSIEASRVDSTNAIVQALAVTPAERRPATFVCASAVGYFGSRGEELLEETASPGEGFLADVCQRWEAAARRAEDAGVRVVSLRFGIVLSHEGGALRLLAMQFRMGAGGRAGSGRQWVPWVHIDDAVGILDAALRDDGYRGPVNVVSPHPVRNAELTTALAQTLRRPALVPAPAFALRLVMGELADELLGSRRCVPAAATARAFEFAHSEIETALDNELS